jgi:hypothetical protein
MAPFTSWTVGSVVRSTLNMAASQDLVGIALDRATFLKEEDRLLVCLHIIVENSDVFGV